GGHLAASLGVHWSTVGSEVNQPNALILCYPVITSGPFAHRGSFDALLGSNPTPEMLKEMSLEKQVNENTPPTFIWHTVADSVVPVENTLLFAQALQSYNIPFEMHIFPNGDHGLSLATAETDDGVRGIHPHIASWITWCIEWLEELFELN
ncbi:MAG: prolyl oligopeptidase family serine peptidase, partial [Firmicutes bacterium]|nr:prolyl oligopeptidase family serine peptidase [Bacillota bacterium]